MPERLWPNGGSTTTPSGPIAVSAICRRPTTPRSAARHRNGTGRCAQSGASRPIPLPHRAWQAQIDLPPGKLDRSELEDSTLAASAGRRSWMKKSRFSEQQIAFVLRQAEEGTPIAEVCRKAGISEASFYSWRKKYGGLVPSEMKRLKQLEEENQRLKKLVADLSLDKEMLQDVIRRKI